MALPLDHLDLLAEPVAPLAGTPLTLRLDEIDEDPSQPRREFDEAKLAELAATIRQRGVLQAISVRPHPEAAGRWMLNYGARRLRASKLAGRADIPAFIDQAAEDYDQVIENEQREGLTPLELALFVKQRLARGDSQQEIARRLGKSKSHITMVGAMIDPPDWLLDAYRRGQCCGVTALYELRRLHESRPDAAQALLARAEPISRAAMRSINDRRATTPDAGDTARAHEAVREPAASETPRPKAASPALLQRRSDALCAELASMVDQLKVCAPDRLPSLRARIAALASR
jgi:ParB family transcriptional regulator, chromosome partitioning protein